MSMFDDCANAAVINCVIETCSSDNHQIRMKCCFLEKLRSLFEGVYCSCAHKNETEFATTDSFRFESLDINATFTRIHYNDRLERLAAIRRHTGNSGVEESSTPLSYNNHNKYPFIGFPLPLLPSGTECSH